MEPPTKGSLASVGPREAASAAALECGLEEKDIAIDKSNERNSFVIQASAMEMPATALVCFLKWAQRNGVRVGFVSEPGEKR